MLTDIALRVYENPEAIPHIVSIETEKQETIEGVYAQLQTGDEIKLVIFENSPELNIRISSVAIHRHRRRSL